MGYDLFSVEEGRHFRASVWGMVTLRDAMVDAKVAFDADSQAPGNVAIAAYYIEGKIPRLGDCFCSNDGWLVTPDECKHIADQLGKWLVIGDLTIEDMKFVQGFAGYCRGCVHDGGFVVN